MYDHLDCVDYNIFEPGYPKLIFHKHIIPARPYKDPNNNIFGVKPSTIEFFKFVLSSDEETKLKEKANKFS